MLKNQIAVLSLQETEIERTFDKNLLRIPGFNLELENNSSLSWVGCYISNELNYKRNLVLEGVDSNLIIIDIEGTNPARIINLYRSFNPQNGVSQRTKFKYQLSLIKESFTNNTVFFIKLRHFLHSHQYWMLHVFGDQSINKSF